MLSAEVGPARPVATIAAPVSDVFRFSVTGYYEDKQGYGVSPEAYATSLTAYNNERLIVPGLFAPKGTPQASIDSVGARLVG